MNAPKPENSVADFIANLDPDKKGMLRPDVAATLPNVPGTLDLDVSSLNAAANSRNSPIAKNPATPSADKRPLAHFGQAAPAPKGTATRKLVLQLTTDQYQYLAHVATLPALGGVALPDLVLAIVQAWREDYRPDIKAANEAFQA